MGLGLSSEKNGMKLEYIIYEHDFIRAGEASSNIKKMLTQLGIDSSIIRRVAIATYEAEINVVIHSHGGTMKVLVSSDSVEILVEDKGPGIDDIELAMKKGFSTATSKVREMGFGAGMGLPNMKRVSDEFFIESQKGESTVLKMIINIE